MTVVWGVLLILCLIALVAAGQALTVLFEPRDEFDDLCPDCRWLGTQHTDRGCHLCDCEVPV